MNDVLLKQLVAFGLSEKEAKIYLSLLELEVASVFEVAKQSGVNRSSAYVVLEGLKKKGLVGISQDKKIRQYIAATPETLLLSAKKAAKVQEDIKNVIESIVPELKAIHKASQGKPVVKIFEGTNGLINSFEDTLSCKEKTIRIISSVEKISRLLPPDYFPNYVKRRAEKGIKMYGIHPNNEIAKMLNKMNLLKYDEPMLIPKEKFKTPADLAIYDNKIGYMSPENGGLAIGIESKELAEVMKNLFDLAWQEAKRLDKKVKH